MSNKIWKFDSSVANIFAVHAERHIPHYRAVLEKTLDICNMFADKNSAIIDIGCATGETLKLLSYNGYTNLYGVDSSQDMLNQCPSGIAKLTCADQLLFEPNFFKIMICNWTLHFVKHKQQYLKTIVDQLAPGGVLVLSEKTSLDPLMIQFYHQIKRKNGVSDQEIVDKEKQIQNIMYINSINWYCEQLTKLDLTVHIIDADYAFTSFLCVKKELS
jgi:tRNA (cmo5U34)-methyltransferase